jgi:hypothetical protein
MALFEPAANRRAIAGQLTWFLAWAGITVIGAILSPSPQGHGTHEQLGLPPCPSVLLFDRPCPGCGLTTSFTATIHGQFAAAFHAHPLGPILYLVFTVSAWLALYGFKNQLRLDTSGKRFTLWAGAAAIVFFAFGVLRWIDSPNYASPGEMTSFFLKGTRQ